LLGASLLTLASQVTSASAHSPQDVVHILRERGYSNINFLDATPPNYMANACREGVRYHFHVNYYGDVTQRRPIGQCGYARYDERRSYADYDQRPHWRFWRRGY
jgi:hypothetical protein